MKLTNRVLVVLCIAMLSGTAYSQDHKDQGVGKAQEHPGKVAEHEGKGKVREDKAEEHQGKGKVREDKVQEHQGKVDENSAKAKQQVGEEAVNKVGKAEDRAKGGAGGQEETAEDRELADRMVQYRDERREREAKIARLRDLAAEKNDAALKAKVDDAERKMKQAEAKKEAALREKYGDAKVDRAKAKLEEMAKDKRGEKAKHLENKGENQVKEGGQP